MYYTKKYLKSLTLKGLKEELKQLPGVQYNTRKDEAFILDLIDCKNRAELIAATT